MIYSRGRSRSLRRQIAQYVPAIRGFALSISGNPDTADDLTQATCLHALEREKQFQPGRPVIILLIRICRSLWLHDLRSEAARKTGGLDTATAVDLIDQREDPETGIFAMQVYAKIMELPEAQRATVELVYVQQFTYNEAADILEVPLGTIMSRLSTARTALAGMNDIEKKRTARKA